MTGVVGVDAVRSDQVRAILEPPIVKRVDELVAELRSYVSHRIARLVETLGDAASGCHLR